MDMDQERDDIPANKRQRVNADEIKSIPWAICLFGYLEVFPQIVQQFHQQVMGALAEPPVVFACVCTQTSKSKQPIIGQLDRVDVAQIQRWLPEAAQCQLLEPVGDEGTAKGCEMTERECLRAVIQSSFEYETRNKVRFEQFLLARPNLYYKIPIHTRAIHQWSGRIYVPSGKSSHVAVMNRSTLIQCLEPELKPLWAIFSTEQVDDVSGADQTVQTVEYPFTDYILAVWPDWVLQQAGFRARERVSTPSAANQ